MRYGHRDCSLDCRTEATRTAAEDDQAEDDQIDVLHGERHVALDDADPDVASPNRNVHYFFAAFGTGSALKPDCSVMTLAMASGLVFDGS